MTLRFLLASLASACVLAACGGDAPSQSAAAPRLLAASASSVAALLSFPGARADYSITETAGGYLVSPIDGSDATAVPRNTRLRFTDTSVALDLDGNAGRAYRLYRAAFDRMPDASGIGHWIGVLDRGLDPALVAGAFIGSSEFTARYGANLLDADFVDILYRNVLHRASDPAGKAFWSGLLERGAATRAQVLAAFSEGAEAKAAARDAIRTGIYFLETGVVYVPAADPGYGRVVDIGQVVTLDGTASTVSSGKSIFYYWTLGQKPAGSKAVLTDAGTAHPSFTADMQGKYEVKLIVSDGIDYSREVKTTVAAVWRADEAQLPATGNLVYLQSESGDYVGSGATMTYTQANAVLSVSGQGRQLTVRVTGDQDWSGELSLPSSQAKLVPGYYGDLGSSYWNDKGGLQWWTDGRSCYGSGWIVIDSVGYEGDQLAWIDLRFEQRCTNYAGALHGRVRWTPGDHTQPPGPVNPAPTGLWQAAAGTTPASGNYVYLESMQGDYVGGGKNYTLTEGLGLTATGARVSVSVNLSDYWSSWSGDFVAMSSLSRLEPGYYGSLRRYPWHNAAKGGMYFTVHGYSCSDVTGWFVVDKVTYVDNIMTELDLRFEQHCDGRAAALHGQIHWRSP